MNFPVKLKNDTVGYITVSENNIYAECKYNSSDILRLFAKTDDKIINLGVLEPKGNLMCLNRKIKKDIINNNTTYYLDDGSGKYITKQQYETFFNAGKEHEFAYLLTACSLKKVNNNWITYIKSTE